MAQIVDTESVTDLVINRIPSQAIFDDMVENDQIVENELYLVEGETTAEDIPYDGTLLSHEEGSVGEAISELDASITQDTLHDTKSSITSDPASINAIMDYDVGIYRVYISETSIFPRGYGILEIIKGSSYGLARFTTINRTLPSVYTLDWNISSGTFYSTKWKNHTRNVYSISDLGLAGTPTMADIASAMPNDSVACLTNTEIDQSSLSNPSGDINVITIFKVSQYRCYALGARAYNGVVLSNANIAYAAFDGTSWVGWRKILVSDSANLAIGNGGTGASTAANARANLGMAYAVNDTFSTNNSTSIVIPGIVNNAKTGIYFTLYVDKSMENISTISVTAMTGALFGPSGLIGSSSTNFASSTYTTSCIKQSNTAVRILLGKSDSTAFSATANSTVNYFGTLTFKFT